MQVSYKASPEASFNIEVPNLLTAFEFVAYANSIFGVKNCGNCQSPNLRLVHRAPQGYNFYSVQCEDCKHELKFGQTKEGNKLFPKGWEEPYSGGSSDDSQDEEKPKAKKEEAKPKDDIPF